MAENEILGISGQMDISDIQSAIDKLISSLDRVGVDTQQMSAKMSSALNDIATSSETSLADRTKKAMDVLQQAITESNSAIESTPQMIKSAEDAMNGYQQACDKLQQQMSSLQKGSDGYDSLQKQWDNNHESLTLAKADYDDLVTSHQKVLQSITEVSTAYDVLSAANTVSAVAEGANAAATVTDATAKGSAAIASVAEGAAHVGTTENIDKETSSKKDNIDITNQMNEANVHAGESLQELKAGLKQNEQALTEDNEQMQVAADKIQQEQDAVDKYTAKVQALKQAGADLKEPGGQTYTTWSNANDNLDKHVAKLQEAKNEYEGLSQSVKTLSDNKKDLTDRINNFGKAQDNASSSTKGATESVSGANTGIKDMATALKDVKSGADGGLSGLLGFASGAGSVATAVGLAASAITYLSSKVQELFEKMLPLNTYVDNDVIGQLNQKFAEASQDSEQSSSDMTDAAKRWVKSYDDIRDSSDKIMTLVNGTRQLSTVSGLEMDKTAKYLSSYGLTFHQTSSEVVGDVNIIANATHASTADYGEMMQALQSSAPRAAQAGLSFKELAALLAVGSKELGSVSTASSAFNTLLLSLNNTVDQFNPNVVGLSQALINLNKYQREGGDLSSILSKRALQMGGAFIDSADKIAVLSNNLDSNKEILSELTNADEKLHTNTAKLGVAWDNFAISLSTNFSPALIHVLNLFRDTLNFFSRINNALNRSWNYFFIWGQKCDKAISRVLSKIPLVGRYMSKFIGWIDSPSGSSNTSTGGGSKTGKRIKGNTSNKKTTNVIKNSEYWGKQEKYYTAQLKSLDDSQKGSKKWNSLVNKIKQAQSHLANYPVSFSSDKKSSKKEENEKERKEKEANTKANSYASKQLKEKQEQAKLEIDLARQTEQTKIDTMSDGSEKERAQAELDHKKRLDQIKKQQNDYINKNIEEAAEKYSQKNPKGKGFYAQGLYKNVGLTSSQQKIINLETISENTKYNKTNTDKKIKTDTENKKAWQEYFTEYGNYQQKKVAITQKYDDEIAKLDGGAQASKIEEKNAALEQLDEQYGNVTKSMADLFEDASKKSVNSIQKIIDKYETLVKYMSGSDKSVTLKDLKDLGFTDKDLKDLSTGKIKISDVTEAIKKLKGALADRSSFKTFIQDLQDAIDKLKKGDLAGGIEGIGAAASAFAPTIKKFGEDIGNIFGSDKLSNDISNVAASVDGLGTTAEGVGQIMSGDIGGGIITSVSGVSKIVSAVKSIFGSDKREKYYENTVAKYTSLKKIWDDLISKKEEYLDISWGSEADSTETEIENLKKAELTGIETEANAYLSTKATHHGKSHTNYTWQNRLFTTGGTKNSSDDSVFSDIEQGLSDAGLGDTSISGVSDFFNLTKDQLEWIKTNYAESWASMDSTFQDYLNDYLDGLSSLEDAQQDYADKYTGSISDMSDTLYDFASDTDATMSKIQASWNKSWNTQIWDLLTQKGTDYYNSMLQYQEDYNAAIADGELTAEEAASLKAEYEAIYTAVNDKYDAAVAASGTEDTTDDQSATTNSIESVTADQGDLIVERMTAIQIGVEKQNGFISSVVDNTKGTYVSMLQVQVSAAQIASDITVMRDIQETGMNNLIKIEKNTRPIADILTATEEIRKIVKQNL